MRDRDQRAGEVAERLKQPGDGLLGSCSCGIAAMWPFRIRRAYGAPAAARPAGRRRRRCRPTARDSRVRTRRSRPRPRAPGAALLPRSSRDAPSPGAATPRRGRALPGSSRRSAPTSPQQRLGIAHDGLQIGQQLVGRDFGWRWCFMSLSSWASSCVSFRVAAVRVNRGAIRGASIARSHCLGRRSQESPPMNSPHACGAGP